jgi:hypothetical protein
MERPAIQSAVSDHARDDADNVDETIRPPLAQGVLRKYEATCHFVLVPCGNHLIAKISLARDVAAVRQCALRRGSPGLIQKNRRSQCKLKI